MINMIEPIVVGNLVLDGEAVRDSNGNYLLQTQQDWEKHFASIGKSIPTVGEYIITLKNIIERDEPVALEGLLQDLRQSALCAGKLNYSKSNIPIGNGYLDILVKDPAWKNALQDEVLQYDAPEAVYILQRATGKRPYIWTPSAEGRRSHPERAVLLYIGTDRSYLYCYDNPISDLGCSRGVRRGASISEQEAPQGATQEIKLLQAPA